ncbi:MAG: hypothetical protein KAH22_04475 [Thiotrichaceae bacterium]|nr:hypothetical protein [Thiotrichaceae bacterium]
MENVNYNKLQKLGLTTLLFSSLFINIGCSGIHRLDQSQVPKVRVSSGQSPTITWTPHNAYQINLYRGKRTRNSRLGEVWSLAQETGYKNKLSSPVTVDITLEKGKTYTVVVQRKSGRFSNTSQRYIGVKTFKVK